KKIADGLNLKLGDPVTVNVLGRNLTARVANLRTVDWQSLGINFVMVFSPGTFRGAPATHIATLTYPGGSVAADEIALLKAVADALMGTQMMILSFLWLPRPAAAAAAGAVAATVVLGLAGTYTALGQKPAPVLRAL